MLMKLTPGRDQALLDPLKQFTYKNQTSGFKIFILDVFFSSLLLLSIISNSLRTLKTHHKNISNQNDISEANFLNT